MGKSKTKDHKRIWHKFENGASFKFVPIQNHEEDSVCGDFARHQKTACSKNSYNGRQNTYSSQSTPTRRYQYETYTKSTRSSSTASENKIQFNEDEYTRINTPRQDVLFKKGYLNKPKNYQTQTSSTGNSTTSTGNSTGNGTPDHQSADLELEQFHYPPFVDQNVYYLNSFESPMPVMFSYHQPTFFPEYSDVRPKRYSTGSLTESTSPATEEASQEDMPSSDFNHQTYNHVMYPEYYHYNGVDQPQDAADQSEPRPVKKKKRRRTRSQEGATTTNSEDSSDEVFSTTDDAQPPPEDKANDAQKLLMDSLVIKDATPTPVPATTNGEASSQGATDDDDTNSNSSKDKEDGKEPARKYDLKPDAEEFVPRSFYQRQETIPIDPVQFIKLPPNFVPVPFVGTDFNGHAAAFIPPGIPINFVPHHPSNYFVPNPTPTYHKNEEQEHNGIEEKHKEEEKEETVEEVPKATAPEQFDIAKIVSKLEEMEAAKKMGEKEEEKKQQQNNEQPCQKPPPYRKHNQRNHKRFNKYNQPEATNHVDQQQDRRNNRRFRQPYKPNGVVEAAQQPKNDEKKPESPRFTKNYSETLKKPTQPLNTKIVAKPKEESEKPTHSPVKEALTPKSPNNPWVSVSSKKKRKNRNVEEIFDEPQEDQDKDLFESYDVNLLEDVVPPSKTIEDVKEEAVEEKVIKEEVKSVEVEAVEVETVEDKPKPSKKNKTKSNNNHTKVVTKRVIIKDMDLSVSNNNLKETSVKEAEEAIIVEEKLDETKGANEAEAVVVDLDTPKEDDKVTEKKKSKSKKKKAKVTNLVNSQSSSTNTINVSDELSVSLLDESQEKTNIEVSQEIDMMIKKRMFNSFDKNSLEIKEDDFFKTVMSNISPEPSVEKNSFKNSTDFNKIFGNTLLKPKPPPPILETVSSTSTRQSFLADVTPNSLGGDMEITRELIKNESKGERLYPITQAVKDWMTRTRENTPEVEILKSPSTINSWKLELDENDEKLDEPSFATADDEVTLYSLSREGSSDLLECWEDEIKPSENGFVEEGQDVLEVYESSYGTNQDFLSIKAEVENQKNITSLNANFPKHGNLPYRAICCSIM